MGTIQHLELNTSDLKGAKKFYGGVFGWKFEDMPMPGGVYTMVSDSNGKAFGGFQAHPMPDAPSSWLNYVSVASAKRAIAKIEKRGGTITVPLMVLPGIGSFAVCADPQGASFAIWEEAPKPKAAKKKAKKKSARKVAKKKSAKKVAKKKPAKKATKEAAKRKTAKRKTAKRKTAKRKTAKKKR